MTNQQTGEFAGFSADKLYEFARSARGGEAARATDLLGDCGPAAEDDLMDLARHKDATVRLAALRSLEKIMSERDYLEQTHAMYLNEIEPTLRRTFIEILSANAFEHSIDPLTEALFDKKKMIAEAARAGLISYGKVALRRLKTLRKRTRPDRRAKLDAVIDAINNA